MCQQGRRGKKSAGTMHVTYWTSSNFASDTGACSSRGRVTTAGGIHCNGMAEGGGVGWSSQCPCGGLCKVVTGAAVRGVSRGKQDPHFDRRYAGSMRLRGRRAHGRQRASVHCAIVLVLGSSAALLACCVASRLFRLGVGEQVVGWGMGQP